MIGRFKAAAGGADSASMTADSAPNPRFRTARVHVPETHEERIIAVLDDTEGFLAEFNAALTELGEEGAWDRVVELARIGASSTDPHHAHAARRMSATMLVRHAFERSDEDLAERFAPLDRAAAVLVPALEEHPHEPELLDLLGMVALGLGDIASARHLFQTVLDIDPSHDAAPDHLRACGTRGKHGWSGVAATAERLAPTYSRARSRVKGISEAARHLPERTISLCMIVKDEEEMLPGCLEAVAPYVDQLIVVDTGSSDRTREIAAEHGATLVEFAWTGSFSDARNEALRHATGDWVLYLDADEHLVEGDGARLRDLARQTWVEGWQLVETHFLGAAELGAEVAHTPMRLFQRRPDYVWSGVVHEQVSATLPTWLPGRIRTSDVRINHFGYLARVVDGRDKRSRNLGLLMSQLEQGRTAFTCFNIGTEHGSAGRWNDAVTWFEEALTLLRTEGAAGLEQQYAPLLVLRTVGSRRETGDVAGAIELAVEALGWWPDYTDLVYELCIAHVLSGDLDEAERLARQALALGDAPSRYVASAGKGSFQARMLLSTILRRRGDHVGAREQLETAVREAPHYLASAIALTELLLDAPGVDASEASRQLDELLADRATGVISNMVVGAVFHEAGHYDVADERYGRVLAAIPTHGGGLLARAELRLAQGALRDAWETALAIDPLDAMAPRGGLTAFLAAAALDDPALLEQPADRIAAATEQLPAAERAVYVAWRALLQPAGSAASIPTLVPTGASASGAVLRNLEALAKLEATDAFERLYPLLAQVVPDEQVRRMALAELYLRRRFADMAGEELFACAERFGADAPVLTGLGKVATMKEMWEDAEIFLSESLQLDPGQSDVRGLLDAVRAKAAG